MEVLDEMIAGGHLDKRKLLQETNNNLKDIKTMLAEDIKDRGQGRGECPVCKSSVECPVCSEEVRRPMRLTQCSQGHIICDDCLTALRISENKNKDCVLCKGRSKDRRSLTLRGPTLFDFSKLILIFLLFSLPSLKMSYVGRPTVLEKLLGLT